MTKREREQLNKTIKKMCDLYCLVPIEAKKIAADFDEWVGIVQKACLKCPLRKFEGSVK